MSQQFDVIVIGAGIAGSTIAYFLAKSGKKVAVVERSHIASGASGAAGAFLSPMMGKPNLVLNMVNSALYEAFDLYREIASDLLVLNGLERFIASKEDSKKFWELAEYIDLPHQKRNNSIFFYDAGVVQAEALCERLLADTTLFANCEVRELEKIDGGWRVLDLIAPMVVVATGAYPSLVPTNYMKMRHIWGERLALRLDEQVKHNASKDVMVSATLSDGTIAIGSTHIRDKIEWQADSGSKDLLLQKGIEILPVLKKSIYVDMKCGMRPATTDYLPVAGRVVDVRALLTKHPEIRFGKRLAIDEILYYDGVYLHTGHGGRGFVTAVHTAKRLVDLMFYGKECAYEPIRLLIKNIRREPDLLESWRDEWIAN